MHKSKDPLVVDHKDRGCKLSPVCLECSLPYCCLDEKSPRKTNDRLQERVAEVDRLGKQGKSVRVIAGLLNVSQRTVWRARALLKL